ncbi:MAG: hypothetical protein IKW66_00320, partial [Clostridia bacterium]|nr:hypothetical protein [Clostridia bacterium]
MLPKLQNYAVWPCVYPAEVLSEVTITANGRSFLLHEGVEYQIRIEPRLADQPDAYAPTVHRKLTATAQNGILRFSHIFAGEQEHTLQLSRDDKVLQEFSVFSLKEDLMCLTPLKGDLHSHSFRSDGKCDPAYLAGV